MRRNHKVSPGGLVLASLVFATAIILKQGLIADALWYKAGYVIFPLLVVSIFFYRKRLK